MAIWEKKILWGVMLLLNGAVGQIVNYPPPVCAMKGSTVTLSCTFEPLKFAGGIKIVIYRVVWCKNHEICQGSFPSVYDSESINNNNNPRFRYLGDKMGNCTLQITDIQDSDEGTYRFRVETDHRSATFTGQLGVTVFVSDLTQMRIYSSVSETETREGETVTLHCTANCTYHQLELTWFRDGHALSETGPALQLGPLTAKDSGKYSCGLKTINGSLSEPYSLYVKTREGTSSGTVDTMQVIRLVLFILHTVLIIIVASVVIKRTCVCKKAAAKR
ncbi:B-cell receptor CD22-like [Plectropomus leopardus]|uniref:B-cell receptor CD22-like n=1 Tax=Plectropomus leopardus TaxID=160734 RepID=UPI001C4B6FF7|nr:B-cell receptor CD22-like [Plectropomus leopardus]XP_042346414.1 B-cell receptor CD22-like [Plectropomus leopardus]